MMVRSIVISPQKDGPFRPPFQEKDLKNVTLRIAAAAAALFLAAAPIPSAMARNAQWTGYATQNVETTGSLFGFGVHDTPFYDGCPMSSAAEGNANQQTRPVKQYGQTAGGNRC